MAAASGQANGSEARTKLMSDSLATIERLLEQANELKNGPERIRVLEEAVRLADQAGDVAAGFRARLKWMDAATFGGRPDILLTAFAWCLAEHDRDPDRFDQKDLLWKYKWVMGHVVQFPHISRAQIESMLADMSIRFEQAGSTLHAVHDARNKILADMGDLAGASLAAAELAATRRDWLSDCRACIRDVSAGRLADQERDAEALAEAAPILAGRVKCAEVPHQTYSRLLLPLLRLGRVQEALAYHQMGQRLIGDNPEFLLAAGRHLEFLTLTGNLKPALALFEVYLPHALATPSLFNRMHFYAAAWLLLETLCDHGERTLRLRLPDVFPLFQSRGIYDLPTILDWFRTEVETLTTQFDTRNGNDYYARWLAGMKDRKSLAISAPLQAEEDY
jgi:hypothetical protein